MLTDWRWGVARCDTTCDYCDRRIPAGAPLAVNDAGSGDTSIVCRDCATKRRNFPADTSTASRRDATDRRPEC